MSRKEEATIGAPFDGASDRDRPDMEAADGHRIVAARRALVAERIALVRSFLRDRAAPAAILRARANFAWITVGGESHVVLSSQSGVAGLLVTERDARVLTAVNEAPRIADEEVAGIDLEVESVPWHDDGAMAAAARKLAAGDPIDDAALESAIRPERSILSMVETERMAWLARRAGAAVREALAAAQPGETEHAVAAEAAYRLAVDGIRAPVVLAAADDRIARYRHPLPGAARIRGRLMLVLVAERWGLHVALTRFAEHEALPDELRRRREAVHIIHDAMVAATRPGTTHGDVLAAARAAYDEAGYPREWELHHQGGSIGYQGRERIATPGDATPIVAGMAFAWNPSIAGAKAEETLVLGDDGPRTLTR